MIGPVFPTPRTPRAPLVRGCSLRLGDVLASRYRVESLVRADDSGKTALLTALHVGDGERVFVDLVLGAPASGGETDLDDARLDLLASARRAMGLAGSRIARVLDAGVMPDGLLFVVREHPRRPTLASVLSHHPSLATAQAVDIALDVCEALAEGHARRLVHGYLTPASVHLTWSPDRVSDVTVTGLGTQKDLAWLGSERPVLRAPEQIDGDADIDGRTDVWAVGSVLYTMLAGAAPFAAETPSTANLSIVLDEPASLAGVPDALAELVDACLSKNPVLRPASVAVLASGLAPFGSARAAETLERIRAFDRPDEGVVLDLVVEKKATGDADVTARRDAVVAAMLENIEAQASSIEIPIDIEPSVRDVTAPPPRAPMPSRDAQTVLTRPKSRSWRAAGIATAASCVALGVVIGIATTQLSSRDVEPVRANAAPLAAPEAPPVSTAIAPVLPASDPAPIAASALADAPASPPPSISAHKMPARSSAPARPRALAAAPEAPADPIVHAAATPPEPQPKASDDDLRRFLDDRR